ncbi:uncharacterized protein [Primulina eburnea]|uniref:uncharacterized protein n=1 Tax=Primulina eburnea TaxID=1245227 RepID=UPI003C6C67BE
MEENVDLLFIGTRLVKEERLVPDVIEETAELDATANDIPRETFDVKGYSTFYFISSSGNVVQYDGDRTKDDMVDFIQKHRNTVAKQRSYEVGTGSSYIHAHSFTLRCFLQKNSPSMKIIFSPAKTKMTNRGGSSSSPLHNVLKQIGGLKSLNSSRWYMWLEFRCSRGSIRKYQS